MVFYLFKLIGQMFYNLSPGKNFWVHPDKLNFQSKYVRYFP